MSWDQGIQLREDMSEATRAQADSLGASRGMGEVQAMVWFGPRPKHMILDYGEHGSLTIKVPRG